MEINTIIIAAFWLGCVLGDTTQFSSQSAPALSSQGAVDNSGYYNTYPSAAGYDYDAGYPLQVQGEEDRQDLFSGGLIGGLGVVTVATMFVAALAGALVAPVLNAGITRLINFELPEITLPEFPVEEVRSLEAKYPWVRMVENVYSALRSEVNMRKSTKFNKFIKTVSL